MAYWGLYQVGNYVNGIIQAYLPQNIAVVTRAYCEAIVDNNIMIAARLGDVETLRSYQRDLQVQPEQLYRTLNRLVGAGHGLGVTTLCAAGVGAGREVIIKACRTGDLPIITILLSNYRGEAKGIREISKYLELPRVYSNCLTKDDYITQYRIYQLLLGRYQDIKTNGPGARVEWVMTLPVPQNIAAEPWKIDQNQVVDLQANPAA